MRPKPTVGTGKPANHIKGHYKLNAQSSFRGGFDGPLNAPIRRTTCPGERSVTLVHTTHESTQASSSAEVALSSARKTDKPRQVFWAKRLEGLRAVIVRPGQSVDQAFIEPLSFGGRVKPVGPSVTEEIALISMVSHLSRPGVPIPIVGQAAPRKALESDAGAYINPHQPLVQTLLVSEKDIAIQEQRVVDARTRLELALKHFG